MFCLTLTRNGSKWTPAWAGIALERPEGHKAKLVFAPREPKVSCTVALTVDDVGGIASSGTARIDATVVLDIASRKVQFGALLFGRACELESQATIGAQIEFSFKPTGQAATASHVFTHSAGVSQPRRAVATPNIRLL